MGKSVPGVQNLPNDFDKKGDRAPASEAGEPVVGGPGSGNRRRFDAKERVEDCLSLDVRRWHREGVLEPGQYSSWAWYRGGRKVSSMGVWAIHGAVELSYSVGSGGASGRKEDVSYTVALTWTPCNFGGWRPWLMCPGRANGVGCGRRVAKLYLRHRYFRCRHCHDLTYASRQETRGRIAAAERKGQRIRRKLDGSADMNEPFPGRPKGMHLRTYMRLFEEYEKPREEYERALVALVEDLERLADRVLVGSREDP